MADKIKENGTNPQDQKKQSIDAIFKSAHDYLSNLEKSMGELLKKFHLNNETFDGDLDGKGTTKNKIDELYKNKVLKLKEELDSNKSQLNKQAIISKVIAMSMEARGITSSALSKEAKEKLQGTDLAEFEKEKNELIRKNNTEEFKKLGDELLNAGKALDSLEVKSVESKGETVKEVLKKEAVSLLEKRAKNEITQEVFEEKMEKTMNEADKFNIEREVSEAFGNKIKEIDLSQAKKVGERSMVSGVLPLGLIMTPGLKKIVPTLPAVIGVGIWARLMHGSATDKAMAIGETALYIAPITGTIMSGKDTWEALQKYLEGKGTMGDIIANGIGTLVSAGFDIFTILAVASGIGTPAAVGLTTVRGAAVQSIKMGINSITKLVGKEIFKDIEKNFDSIFKVSKDFVVENTKIAYNTAITNPGKVIQQSIKETGEGLHSLLTFKSIRESKLLSKYNDATFGKVSDAMLPAKIKAFEALEKANIVPKGATERIATSHIEGKLILNETRPEDSEMLTRENELTSLEKGKNTKSLDLLLQKINETAKNGSKDMFEDTLNVLIVKDKYIGKSLETLTTFKENLENNVKLKEILDKADKEKNISTGLYNFLTELKDSNITTKDKNALLNNKIFGSIENNAEFYEAILKINKVELKEGEKADYDTVLKYGLIKDNLGYRNDSFKIIKSIEDIFNNKKLLQGLSHDKKTILVDKYLELLKQSDDEKFSQIRYMQSNGTGLKELDESSLYEHKILSFLKNNDFKDIHGHIFDSLDINEIKNTETIKIYNELTSSSIEKIEKIIKNIKKDLPITALIKYKQEGIITQNSFEHIIKEFEKTTDQKRKDILGKLISNIEKLGFKNNNDIRAIFDNLTDSKGKIEDFREYKRLLIKNLEQFKDNHLEIRAELINLMKDEKNGLGIKEKIDLLKVLEKTGIIKPRAEEKFDYVESIKESNVDELRGDISYIKDYLSKIEKEIDNEISNAVEITFMETKIDGKKIEFNKDINLKELNRIKTDIKNGRKGLIANTNKELSLYNLRVDSGEYIKVGEEYFAVKMNPNRYFLKQFIDASNHKRAEAYMELIHDKSDFGGNNIKELFNSPDLPLDKKLLLCYHDQLKYDPGAIKLLLDNAQNPEHAATVLYVIQKRKDLDFTKEIDEIAVYKNDILEQLITKELLEQKEGRPLTEKEYIEKKKMLIDVIGLSKNPKIQSLIQSIRVGEETNESASKMIDEIKLEKGEKDSINSLKVIEQTVRQGEESVENINKFINQKFVDFIIGNKDMFSRMLGEKANLLNDVKNLHKNETIKSIINIIKENNNLSLEEKSFAVEFSKVYENSDIIAKTGKEFNILTSSVENLFLNLGDIISVIRSSIENNELKIKKSSETPINLPFIGEMTPKKAIILALSLGLMTRQEAEASQATWEKIDKLEAEGKMEEAKKLKAEAITEITKLYISQFPKIDLADRSIEKINHLNPKIQEILFRCFDLGVDLIPESDKKSRMFFSTRIYTFFEKVNYNTGGAKERLERQILTLPGMQGSKLYETLSKFADENDNIVQTKLNGANKEYEKLKQEREERKKEREERQKKRKERKKEREERQKKREERQKRLDKAIEIGKTRDKLLGELNQMK